jgi:hypothetical protein
MIDCARIGIIAKMADREFVVPNLILAAPQDHSPDGIRTWIRGICAAIGSNPTQLSLDAGLAASTINRFMRSTDPEKNISATTIQVLLDAANLAVAHGNIIDRSESIGREEVPEAVSSLVTVPVVGRALEGAFVRNHQWNIAGTYQVHIPIPLPYAMRPLFGIEISDDHAAHMYPAGSIVVVISMKDMMPGLASGERILVLTENKTEEVETTIREYHLSPNGDAWLVGLGGPSPDIYLGKSGEHRPSERTLAGKILVSIQPEPSIGGGVVA